MRGDKASQSRWNASIAEEPGREHSSKMERNESPRYQKKKVTSTSGPASSRARRWQDTTVILHITYLTSVTYYIPRFEVTLQKKNTLRPRISS